MKVVNRCDFYNGGFFGYGLEGDFKYFSIWHFLPIIVMIISIILVYKYRDKIKNAKWEENFRYFIAVLLFISELGFYLRILYVGSETPLRTNILTKLPFQVCDISCIIAMFMMTKKSKNLYSYCYFVCLSLGLIPLITPAVITTTGPTYFRYYQYWFLHILPIFSVFYLTFVHGFRVKLKDMIKPIVILLCLAFVSIYFNSKIPGARFMYLQGVTEGNSIANLIPDNPFIRLEIYGLISIVLFFIAYIPTYLIEKKHIH